MTQTGRRRVVLILATLAAGLALVLPPASAAPSGPLDAPAASTGAGGYWMVEANGNVYGFGDAHPLNPVVQRSIVAATGLANGGYLLLSGDGTVTTRATPYFGSASLGDDVATTIAALSDGSGYWVFTQRGAVHAFGAAQSFGDMTGLALNGGIIASAVTPSGHGYWMVGSDGGIFSFGDAAFFGSTGGIHLNKPVVGIAPDPDGAGYWLVAADGGIFAFSAPFRGSVPGALASGQQLNRAVIGALAYGDGYLMVAADGGIFAFSDLAFLGSLGANPPVNPIVAVAVRVPSSLGQGGAGGPGEGPPGTTTTTTTTQPGAPVSLSAAQVGPGIVEVRWSDGVTPTKLGRNGADGGWDTDRDSFGGVPYESQLSRSFQFTALAPGPYNFTMTYFDQNGAQQNASTDAVQVFASATDPATPGTPSAVGRVQSARLLYSQVGGDVAEYQWNATVSACCGGPPSGLPPTGWHTVPADNVLNLRSYGSSGSGHFRFQIRACNSAGVCGIPSGFSESITVYHLPDTPKGFGTPTVVRNGAEALVTWSWFSQIGWGLSKPETFTPSIAYFEAYVYDRGFGFPATIVRIAPVPRTYGAVDGTYSQSFPLDGREVYFYVYAIAYVDGVQYTGQQGSFTSPPLTP